MVLWLVALLAGRAAAVAGGKDVLVLLDDWNTRHASSKFFDGLEGAGFELDYWLAEGPDAAFAISEYGEYLYDHIVLFAPALKEFGGNLTLSAVTDFVDSGRSMLVAASADSAGPVADVVAAMGSKLDATNTCVMDHVSYDAKSDPGDHTNVLTRGYADVPGVFATPSKPLLFSGVAQKCPTTGLLMPLVTAEATAYSYYPDEVMDSAPLVTGRDVVLVSALQARNNARVVMAGSLDMFSNAFATPETSNEQVALEMALWAFGERGRLRVTNMRHDNLADERSNTDYRVDDVMRVEVDIEQLVDGAWVPAPDLSVYAELQMLQPYIRKPLAAAKGSVTYAADIQLPDVYGVFTLKIVGRNAGFSRVFVADEMIVRPFRTNEFERFIPAAYPYYASVFSTIGAFLIFSFVFLYTK